MKSLKRIAITGAAGQIAGNLIFRIASGELLGSDQPIALHLLETKSALPALEGVLFELQDCAFPLLKEVVTGDCADEVFAGVDLAFLVGARPRTVGMERRDLLQANGAIFVKQGRALGKVAQRDVRVLVVGNPCNTNCLIALSHAPNLSPRQFHAMTRLDQNRVCYQLAAKAGVSVASVQGVTIWGNHSATQVPDVSHATIRDKRALESLPRQWLLEGLVTLVQQRGARIIEARGKSSAASAAHAALEAMRDLYFPSASGAFYSSGMWSDGNPYGVAPGLVFSFPCVTLEDGAVDFAEGLAWDPDYAALIARTEKELLEERDAVKDLL